MLTPADPPARWFDAIALILARERVRRRRRRPYKARGGAGQAQATGSMAQSLLAAAGLPIAAAGGGVAPGISVSSVINPA